MVKKTKVNQILKPLEINPTQYYLGTGLHTLGLLGWILEQTGRADVYVSTFSTSDAFLSGFHRLRKRGLINNASLVAEYDKYTVSVISSQNQTYGDRAECTMVTTSQEAFYELFCGLKHIVNDKSLELNGLFNRLTEKDRRESKGDDDPLGDIIPFGY